MKGTAATARITWKVVSLINMHALPAIGLSNDTTLTLRRSATGPNVWPANHLRNRVFKKQVVCLITITPQHYQAFLKHVHCHCKWCSLDYILKVSRHLGKCHCVWCNKDTVDIRADVPENITSYCKSNISNSNSLTVYTLGSGTQQFNVNETNPLDKQDGNGEESKAMNASLPHANYSSYDLTSSHHYHSNGYSSEIEAWAMGEKEDFSSREFTVVSSPGHSLTKSFSDTNLSSQSGTGQGTNVSDTRVQPVITSDSLLSDVPWKVNSNYSLTNTEGPTLSPGSRVNTDVSRPTISHGLHTQWGVTFGVELSMAAQHNCQTIDHSDMLQWVQLAQKEVARHNKPNYLGARVQVISQLNIPLWRTLLKEYKYNRVVDYLQFSFPVSLDYSNFEYSQQVNNHASATKFPEAVNEYIATEIKHKALVGPFKDKPLPEVTVVLMKSIVH